MNMTILYYNSETDEEYEVEIPCEYEVCPRCRGNGSHVHPDVDGHGISPEEFAEDPDFRESYFTGVYDVCCYECGGKRVVPVPVDDKFLNDEQKAALEYDAERAADRAMDARIMRMENGEW